MNFFHNMTPETVAAALAKKQKLSKPVQPCNVDEINSMEGETDVEEVPSKRIKYNTNNDDDQHSDHILLQCSHYCNVLLLL